MHTRAAVRCFSQPLLSPCACAQRRPHKVRRFDRRHAKQSFRAPAQTWRSSGSVRQGAISAGRRTTAPLPPLRSEVCLAESAHRSLSRGRRSSSFASSDTHGLLLSRSLKTLLIPALSLSLPTSSPLPSPQSSPRSPRATCAGPRGLPTWTPCCPPNPASCCSRPGR